MFKNLLGKTNLDIVYNRVAYSKIKRKRIEDRSKIYMNKVYRSNLVTDSYFREGVFHYIIFSDEYRFYDIKTTSKDIEVPSIANIKRRIEEKQKSFKKPMAMKDTINRSINNPIKGYYSSGYKIKDNLLIPSNYGQFSAIVDDPKIEQIPGGVQIEPRSRPCKKIQIVTREKLKCDNGMVYFLLDVSK